MSNTPIHPECFTCPITHQLMLDPFIDSEGNSYEKKAIINYLLEHDKSPVTGNKILMAGLIKNKALKKCIDNYITERRNRNDALVKVTSDNTKTLIHLTNELFDVKEKLKSIKYVEDKVDELVKTVDGHNNVISELSNKKLDVNYDNDSDIIDDTCKIITFEILDVKFPHTPPIPSNWIIDRTKIKINDEYIYYENINDSPNKKLHFPNLNFRSYIINLITKENSINLQLYVNTPEYDEQLNQYMKTHIDVLVVYAFIITYLNTIYHVQHIRSTIKSPGRNENNDRKYCVFVIPNKEPQCDTYHDMNDIANFKFDCKKKYKLMKHEHLIKEFKQ